MDLNEFTKSLIIEGKEKNNPFSSYSIDFEKRNSFNSIDNTQAFGKLYSLVGNEGNTRAIISSIFWDIITSSNFFDYILNYLRISNPISIGGKLILTMQPDELGLNRFDLLILSPEIRQEQSFVTLLSEIINGGRVSPLILGLDPLYADLFNIVERRKTFYEKEYSFLSDNRNFQDRYNDYDVENADRIEFMQYLRTVTTTSVIIELLQIEFRIIFAPMPKTIFTSGVPSPACGIALNPGGKAYSSVGVVACNADGRMGVTGAFHGMHIDPEELSRQFHKQGAMCLIGKEVFVNGKRGVILDADELTDSCFIAIEKEDIPQCIPYLEPLSNRPPYRSESVHFEGISSAKIQTHVTEIDVGIPGVSRGRQRCVYTKPVTNRGDSGSALINIDNQLVGFSFRRTGWGEPIEYSEWIWANSVFNTLQLKKP